MTERPTKAEIVDQIRLFVSKFGETPGKGSFAKFCGINESAVAYYWPRWGDAVRDAGFTPLTVPELIDETAILEKLADLTIELGYFPTTKEYGILKRAGKDIPAEITVRKRLGNVQNSLAKLRAFAHANERYTSLLNILQIPDRSTGTDLLRVVSGYVYLRKLPDRYKIGHTTSIPKREQQHRTKTWEKSELVHVIETDDPEGIEDYWKRRFKDKNKKTVDGRLKEITPTEEFYLTGVDVKAFCRRTYQ